MGQFTIYSQQNMEYTFVSNQFIDHYMEDANEIQLKVYLFLLRHISQQQTSSISDLADHFNYSEKDILRALTYWEKKKILCLNYDENQQLCNIELLEITKTIPVPTSPQEQLSSYYPSQSGTANHNSTEYVQTDGVIAKLNHNIKENSQSEYGETPFSKPNYSLDQLTEFKKRESTSQLVFIAESYLGKSLSVNDVRSMLFLSEELRFSFDLIDYLLQYCIDRGKKDFRYIEKVAINWAEANITSPQQAQNHISCYDKQTYTVMRALGKSSTPTPTETEFIKRWYQIYGFTSDVILEACQRTVLATDSHRFEYADKILSNWKNAGVHHKPDIAKIDASFEKKKTIPSNTTTSKNKFNQFQQNHYDFDALEKELLSN